ncbi:hypothetical protein C791_3593 [Amycolatopsis azurea DSM 43854]|uniref:Uncharacterized protein n=1 Tax=Amycolatopsis azurea DSM 43854 TaxID=1238180 RepID=M2PPJ4_9PSEU|nr:hypothetical protein C791_3593 [Amycolatopsis azurea DSM 43854]
MRFRGKLGHVFHPSHFARCPRRPRNGVIFGKRAPDTSVPP